MTACATSGTIPVPEAEDDEYPLPILRLLRALGIVAVTYVLNGGGDSGECELESVRYADGSEAAKLPSIPTGFRDDGEIQRLDIVLENIAADLPEGDWVNNEGGQGTVSFFPFEPHFEDRVVSDMTFHDEDDYEDEEDFDDIDPPDDHAADSAMMLIAFEPSQEGAVR